MAKKKESKEKLERTYNIPLRKSFRNKALHRKTPRAVRTVKEFLEKHMKSENVLLGAHLNEFLWKRGIKNPPHHVAVDVMKEGDVVKAELKGYKFKGAVKIEKRKDEPATMKDKLEAKMGVKADKDDQAEKTVGNAEDKKAEEKPKVETQPKPASASKPAPKEAK